MDKINVWKIVNDEAANVIKGIQKGEIKCVCGYRDYLDSVYSWKIVEGISRIVETYAYVNGIELPFEIDSDE